MSLSVNPVFRSVQAEYSPSCPTCSGGRPETTFSGGVGSACTPLMIRGGRRVRQRRTVKRRKGKKSRKAKKTRGRRMRGGNPPNVGTPINVSVVHTNSSRSDFKQAVSAIESRTREYTSSSNTYPQRILDLETLKQMLIEFNGKLDDDTIKNILFIIRKNEAPNSRSTNTNVAKANKSVNKGALLDVIDHLITSLTSNKERLNKTRNPSAWPTGV